MIVIATINARHGVGLYVLYKESGQFHHQYILTMRLDSKKPSKKKYELPYPVDLTEKDVRFDP